MKPPSQALAVVAGLLALASTTFGDADAKGPVSAVVCSKASLARAGAALGAAPGAAQPADLPEDPTAPLSDVLSDRLEISIDFSNRRISGRNTMVFRAIEPLGAFRFRLRRNMAIVSARLDGEGISPTRIDDFTVEALFDPLLDRMSEHELAIEYMGAPASNGLGGFLFTEEGSSTYAWTLSQPWSAGAWWPVKDDSRDKRQVSVSIEIPSGQTAISNGVLEATDDLGEGRTRWRYRSAFPVAPYLVFLAAGPYVSFSDTLQLEGYAMPIDFALYKGHDGTSNRDECREVGEMVRTFSALFGLYPFVEEKYGIYEFGFGGGMEHQTMSGQGRCDGNLSAHELGHQWWGDHVTCATWHDIWLNEGFATYAEALWQENRPGGGSADLRRAMENRRPTNAIGTVWVEDTSDIGRIFDGDLSYLKGSWVLHMLRHVVGDTTFFAILQRWRESFGGGSATTDDFVATAEDVYGRPLDWFFDRWVYGPGVPSYEWSWRSLEAAGRHFLELRVRQTQSSSWGTFTMPIDWDVATIDGTTRARAWNDGRDEWLVLELPAEPRDVTFDPDGRILTRTVSQKTHVAGPARIVDAWPPPGSRVTAVHELRVAFLESVETDADDYALVGPNGSVEFGFRWDAETLTAVLTPATRLAPGAWRLAVSDSVRSVASGMALDGEIGAALGGPPLPSGDGTAGGAAEIEFMVGSSPRMDVPPAER